RAPPPGAGATTAWRCATANARLAWLRRPRTDRSNHLLPRVADLAQRLVARRAAQRMGCLAAVPQWIGYRLEPLLEPLAPAGADRREVRVVLVDAHALVGAQPVALVDEQVQRQADSEVRLHGRVHRHQGALGGLRERGRRRQHAVEDGLAVLAFAGLEKAGLAGGLDEVAGRIDQEEPRRLLADLAAEDHGRVELHAGRRQRRSVLLLHAAHRAAEHPRGVV